MRLIVVIVIALTVSACGGSNSPTAPTPAPTVIVVQQPAPTPVTPSGNPNVVGEWTGTLRSGSGTTRAIRMTMVGAYSASSYLLSGNWSFVGTSEGATLQGLVQSNPFVLRINASTSSAAWCSYSTTLTASGNSISGNYSTDVCFGRGADTGTISLNR